MKSCTKCGQLHPPKLPCHLANVSQDTTIANNEDPSQQTIQRFEEPTKTLLSVELPAEQTFFDLEADNARTLLQPEKHRELVKSTNNPLSSQNPIRLAARAYQVTPKGANAPQTASVTPPELAPGVEIDGYLLEEYLGSGGMGEVWRAVQPTIKRKVAVKVLDQRLAMNKGLVERFLQEAQIVNQIQHRNIIDIFGFGEILGTSRPYLVMEYLEGRTLSRYLQERGQMPLFEVLPLLEQICEAIGAAHQHGVIHRDLKPDNIFLTGQKAARFFVKVLDFGFAKTLRTGESLTQAGEIFGTPEYMSPEQCISTKEIDHRADLYSLGIILFEMICGHPPFEEAVDKRGQLWMRHISQDPPLVTNFVRGRALPPGIDQMLQRCLAKEPDTRYQTATEFFEAFRAVAHNSSQINSLKDPTARPKEVAPTRLTKRKDSDPPKAAFLAPGQAPPDLDFKALNATKQNDPSYDVTPIKPTPTTAAPSNSVEQDSTHLLPSPKQGVPVFYLGIGIATAIIVFFLMIKFIAGGSSLNWLSPLTPKQSSLSPAMTNSIATSLSKARITQNNEPLTDAKEIYTQSQRKPIKRQEAKALALITQTKENDFKNNSKETTLNPVKKP
jgi:serine/threonine protein kinase